MNLTFNRDQRFAVSDSIFKQIGLILLATALFLSGCDSGGEESNSDQGDVVIGLTDAAGDFLAYRVDVKSLKLTHNSGTVVETLPLSTTIDFTQYAEVTEFLTSATVPSGTYESATMVLDYTNAQIVVQDGNGVGVQIDRENIKDAEGNRVTELEMNVQLSSGSTFVIAPGIPAHVTLDFDLDASNTIDDPETPTEVVVEPVLLADTKLEDSKPHRLRGLLQSVDVGSEIFSVRIRPFHRLTGPFGSLRVNVLDSTHYEIDNTGYSGATGLAQLAQMPPTSAVVVYGQLKIGQHRFEALEVYAGTSVPWGDKDIITGHVVARSGDGLTLKGATVVRGNNSVVFNDEVTVNVGTATHVSKQGSFGEDLDKDDLSVGQRVTVVGTLSGSDVMDATEGYVRMLYTNLNGEVVQLSPLIIDLQSIDGRRAEIFDFSGTGSDKDAYAIQTGTLSLDDIAVTDPVKVRGFVTGFGDAPPDFVAQTVVNVQNLPTLMAIHWLNQGTTAPFVTQSPTKLTVDLNSNNLGELHHVFRAGVATDLMTLDRNPGIGPHHGLFGLYAIAQNRSVQVFTTFGNFEGALSDRLDGATTLDRIYARGRFDDNEAELAARSMIVRLH